MTGNPGQGSEHRYSRAVLRADLLRGFAGLILCATLIVMVQPASWLVLVLAVFASLFGGYVLRVLQRCRSRIEMDSQSLRVFANLDSKTPLKRLDWNELERLDLDYFCTRRDGRGGWLQLRLRAGDCTVRVDSRLSGFESILARAVVAARACGIALSAASAGNLLAIGFEDALDNGGDIANDESDAGRCGEGRVASRGEAVSVGTSERNR